MRTVGIAFFLTGVVLAAFMVGVTTQQTIPLFGAFCAWTPVAWFTGWAMARSGIHISVNSGGYTNSVNHHPKYQGNSQQSPVRRKRQPTREEFQ